MPNLLPHQLDSNWLRHGSQKRDGALDALILLALLAIQPIVNDGWVYTQVGLLDAWYNIGYAYHYFDPSFLNYYYKAARLPWILIEVAVRHLFRGAAASWALQLTMMATTELAVYFAVRMIYDRRVAILTAAIFALLPFSHANGGADYHNTASGAFFALTWLTTVYAALRARDHAGWLFLAGAFGALTVHSNVIAGNLAFFIIAQWLVLDRPAGEGDRRIGRFLVLTSAGALTATAVLCIINWLDGRGPFFFMKMFGIVTSYVADNAHQSPWYRSISSGFFLEDNYAYLGLFVGGFLASLLVVAASLKSHVLASDRRYNLFYAITFVSYCIWWFCWHLLGQNALNFDYFAYPLLFPLLGVVAAISAIALRTHDSTKLPTTAFYLACIGPALLAYVFADRISTAVHHLPVPGIFRVAALLTAAALAFVGLRKIRYALPVGMLLLGMAGVCADLFPDLFGISSCRTPRDAALVIEKAHRLLYSLQPDYNRVFLWADPDEATPADQNCKPARQQTHLLLMAAGVASTGFNYVEPFWEARKVADIDESHLKHVESLKGLVAYATTEPARAKPLMDRFRSDGRQVLEMGSRVVSVGTVSLPVTLFSVGDMEPDYQPKLAEVGDTLAKIELSSLQSSNAAKLITGAETAELVTPEQRWTYSAYAPLQSLHLPSSSLIIRVRMRVLKGAVSFSVAHRDNISNLIAEVEVSPSNTALTHDLKISDGQQAGTLVFRNVSGDGASEAQIESIEVFGASGS